MYVICLNPKCKEIITLSKDDIKFRKTVDSMGLGSFGKLCKKHDKEMHNRITKEDLNK